jgi:hypothetical protein
LAGRAGVEPAKQSFGDFAVPRYPAYKTIKEQTKSPPDLSEWRAKRIASVGLSAPAILSTNIIKPAIVHIVISHLQE